MESERNRRCLKAWPAPGAIVQFSNGIVDFDHERCIGWGYCVKGCPYKKSYYNPAIEQSQKCIFCYPRREDPKGFPTGRHSFCFTQCVGRIRHVGVLKLDEEPLSSYNKEFGVNRLIHEFKVALRLHPEFGTEPNLFYIPPLSSPTFDAKGKPTGKQRIPIDVLADLFGDTCNQTHQQRVDRITEIFNTLNAAINGQLPEPRTSSASPASVSSSCDILSPLSAGDY